MVGSILGTLVSDFAPTPRRHLVLLQAPLIGLLERQNVDC
jgi:hypothetical protein